MLVFRFYFICFAGLIATLAFATGNGSPRQSSEKHEPPSGTKDSITFSSVHVDEPYIALTFDDGPSAKLTPKLLDLLAAHHIKATFFVIGENVAEHPEIVARAAREGHEIGNHSWSHPYFARMSDDNVRSQLRRTDDAIRSAIGIGQLSCGRHTDRLRHAKNAGFTMNLDTESFFGTSIRMTGNGRARLWFVIVFLRRLSGVRLSYPTIFTREPSRRCPLLWMH